MKMLRVPLLLIGLLLCSQGFAATAQQNKMTTCKPTPVPRPSRAMSAKPL